MSGSLGDKESARANALPLRQGPGEWYSERMLTLEGSLFARICPNEGLGGQIACRHMRSPRLLFYVFLHDSDVFKCRNLIWRTDNLFIVGCSVILLSSKHTLDKTTDKS